MPDAPTPRTLLLARADVLNGLEAMPGPRPDGSQEPAGRPRVATDSEAALQTLQREVEANFPGCQSLDGASHCVFGEGSSTARIVFIGEAPGAEEDRQGRPFVGPAGRKLDEIIRAMGLEREDVYICNVLKARPPGNRTPLPDEVAMSAPWLWAQLRAIQPRVIVALGGPAAKILLDTEVGITSLRGRWGRWEDPEGGLAIDVMPTFHPAYLLRKYTAEIRGQVWDDMQKARDRLDGPQAG